MRVLQVDGDAMRLTQVLLYLLNNAAKYTPERGKIRLQAGHEGGHIILRVHDNGYGIAADFVAAHFRPVCSGRTRA